MIAVANHPHPDGLAAAKACAIPGACLFCEEPLPHARWSPKRATMVRHAKLICESKECTAAYLRAWHRDARARNPERYGTRFYREAARR